MKEYQRLFKQWLFTMVSITLMTLIALVIITIVGVVREQYLQMVAINLSLVAIWYLLCELLQFAKPVPPMRVMPMPIPMPPKKENNNDTTKDL